MYVYTYIFYVLLLCCSSVKIFLFYFFLRIRFTDTKLTFHVKSRISFLDNNLSRLNRRIDVQLCNLF